MARDEGETFLSRWSRLKKAVRRAESVTPEPKADASPARPAAPPAPFKESPAQPAGVSSSAATPLPPIDSLKGLASEYTEFLKPGVDESLKRAALKKLFKDPHFETFERFAEYCEDYTQSETIPPAMLKTLEHAKGLLFDEKKEEETQIAEGGKQPEAPALGEAKAQAAPVPPLPDEKKEKA